MTDLIPLLRSNGGKMHLTAILAATGLNANELFVQLNTLEALGKVTVETQGWNTSALVSIVKDKQTITTHRQEGLYNAK